MPLRYESLSRSAGNRKWIGGAAVADYGDSLALWVPPKVPFALGIAVGSATLINRSGGAAAVGLGARFPVGTWVAGTITSAGTYTAATAAAQDSVTNDFTMMDRTDSGSGFLAGCQVPFNLLGIVQRVSGDQTGPVLILEYWNGSSWVDISGSALIKDALIGAGAMPAEAILCFPLPSDWATGGTGTAVPTGYYNLRVRHTVTGAGASNPVADQLFLGFAKMEFPALGNNQAASLIREKEFPFPRPCEALFPVFGVASRSNTAEVDVRAY